MCRKRSDAMLSCSLAIGDNFEHSQFILKRSVPHLVESNSRKIGLTTFILFLESPCLIIYFVIVIKFRSKIFKKRNLFHLLRSHDRPNLTRTITTQDSR